MASPYRTALTNSFVAPPRQTAAIESPHRRIATPLPSPQSISKLEEAARLFPLVNCYQPPILWDRASGYQVFDSAGNIWIDFTSTAVTTNTGHGHPAIRRAVAEHAESGLLAQFNFASEIRIELAARLVELAPAHCDKVLFWTVGSEAIESALRLVRLWGLRQSPEKYHVLTHAGDFHGWTLGAHQLSGESADKPWLPEGNSTIHHLPFPRAGDPTAGPPDGSDWWEARLEQLDRQGISGRNICAFVIETVQGWGALRLPTDYIQAVRVWADRNDVLLVFDEIQTGFGRTGRLFGHEHYEVRADLICVGKGLTSSLPLAAVLGPADVLDLLGPAEITTTHAAHPLSCAAALANLDLLQREQLVAEAERKGELVRRGLEAIRRRFPRHVFDTCGLGLLQAIHVRDPRTGQPSRELARDWTWAAVCRGVMLFQVNQPTIKVCPPLIIPDDALLEGIDALGEALASLVD